MNNVNLNVSNTVKRGTGWHEVTAKGSTTKFWYKYNGGGSGNDGNNESYVGDPADSFVVTFTGNDGDSYEFTGYSNKEETSDLTGTVDSVAQITVTDSNLNAGVFGWSAWVKEKASGLTVECDPRVTNRNRAK